MNIVDLLIGRKMSGGTGGEDFEINDASYLFYHGARKNIMDILMKHIKDCTDMTAMFRSCVKQEVDLSGVDASNVRSMEEMFYACGTLTSILFGDGWDTSRVENMRNMFFSCYKLPAIEGIGNWDTSSVRDMEGLFQGCTILRTLDLKKWDTSSVESMTKMFQQCSSLTAIEGIENWDTSKVTNMDNIFTSCLGLEKIIGFSSPAVVGGSNMFPSGSTAKRPALKRLTFRDLGPTGYAIRSAINIRHAQLTKANMVEMFQSLPDLTVVTASNRAEVISADELVSYAEGFCSAGTGEDTTLAIVPSDETMPLLTATARDVAGMSGLSAPDGSYYDLWSLEYPLTVVAGKLLEEYELSNYLYEINSSYEEVTLISSSGAEYTDTPDNLTSISDLTYPVMVVLPAVSPSESIAAAYRTITITGNPCVTGTLADGTACDVLSAAEKSVATDKGWVLVT